MNNRWFNIEDTPKRFTIWWEPTFAEKVALTGLIFAVPFTVLAYALDTDEALVGRLPTEELAEELRNRLARRPGFPAGEVVDVPADLPVAIAREKDKETEPE